MSKKDIYSYEDYIKEHYQEQKIKGNNKRHCWKIPVTWEECGMVYIPKTEEMNSIQKAFDYVSEHLDEIELKSIIDKECVEDSLRLSHEDIKEIEVYQ